MRVPGRVAGSVQLDPIKNLGTSSSSPHRPLYYMHDEIKGPRRTQSIYIFTVYIVRFQWSAAHLPV